MSNMTTTAFRPNPKSVALSVVASLLLLFALARFWSMYADWRASQEVNRRVPSIQDKVVTHAGFNLQLQIKAGPFDELNLTDAQREKIDQLVTMNHNAPPRSFTVKGDMPPDKPRFFRMSMPMDKIMAILTPEQRRKLGNGNRMHGGGPVMFGAAKLDLPPLAGGGPMSLSVRSDHGKGPELLRTPDGGAPPPDGSGMVIIRTQGSDGGQ